NKHSRRGSNLHMKRFIAHLALSALLLPNLAQAEDDKPKRSEKQEKAVQKWLSRQPGHQKPVQNVQPQRNVARPPQVNPNVANANNANVANANNLARVRNFEGRRNWQDGRINRPRVVQPEVDSSVSVNDWQNRSGNNSEWNRQRWSGRHNWDRRHRNRAWWRSNYTRFALFGGGYYYWNGGYWYPAYGYDPYFNNYSYDGPLYAYNNQDPGQVIADVQAALNRRGYYAGSVDGTYGPQTRRALLGFQRDNGLPVTGQIDAETLGTLAFR
ncbi:MAG: peptidoglycan-binding protein, partial [Verrucomicrobiaceae bacterium]|nr:peptidoglycan-binding protein [Verrucomicrobiaceae bacterium]